MLNTWLPNGKALNGPGAGVVVDWEAFAPVERMRVYVLDVGDARIPISSAQATMKVDGQSFLQAVVPAALELIDPLAGRLGAPMILRAGYRYVDGSMSPLEIIATAPFQQMRRDQGPVKTTLTISGYGEYPAASPNIRTLQQVQTRSVDQNGRRRVRARIDLFLRPGQTAIDQDGESFRVGSIQYFINAASEGMEVMQDG